MTLEEIKTLTNEELGKRLVIKLDLPCSDEYFGFYIGDDPRWFSELCESLDLILFIEKVVIDKVESSYLGYLSLAVGNSAPILTKKTMLPMVVANARLRAEACLLSLENQS